MVRGPPAAAISTSAAPSLSRSSVRWAQSGRPASPSTSASASAGRRGPFGVGTVPSGRWSPSQSRTVPATVGVVRQQVTAPSNRARPPAEALGEVVEVALEEHGVPRPPEQQRRDVERRDPPRLCGRVRARSGGRRRRGCPRRSRRRPHAGQHRGRARGRRPRSPRSSRGCAIASVVSRNAGVTTVARPSSCGRSASRAGPGSARRRAGARRCCRSSRRPRGPGGRPPSRARRPRPSRVRA